MQALSKFLVRSISCSSKVLLKNSLTKSHTLFAPQFLKSSVFHLSSLKFSSATSNSLPNKYQEDLKSVANHNENEIKAYQEVLDKYYAFQDPHSLTKEESSLLLRAFFQLAKVCYESPGRTEEALAYSNEALTIYK